MFFRLITKGSRKSLVQPREVLQQGKVFIFNFPLHVASDELSGSLKIYDKNVIYIPPSWCVPSVCATLVRSEVLAGTLK